MEKRFIRQMDIASLAPRNMDDVKVAANQLKGGNAIIINTSNLNSEEKLWAVHFLNGVIFALNGSVHELSVKVFLFAPPDVVVS